MLCLASCTVVRVFADAVFLTQFFAHRGGHSQRWFVQAVVDPVVEVSDVQVGVLGRLGQSVQRAFKVTRSLCVFSALLIQRVVMQKKNPSVFKLALFVFDLIPY